MKKKKQRTKDVEQYVKITFIHGILRSPFVLDSQHQT